MDFENVGFEIHKQIITLEQVQSLLSELKVLELEPLTGGIRRIDQRVDQVACLASSAKILSIARCHLPGPAKLVRAIYFDKSPTNNWLVSWHQDKTVAVSNRFEADDWRAWSIKAGVWHVQPPISVLQAMVTIRIHLDDTSPANGCLKVIPGSHKQGILGAKEIQDSICPEHLVYCAVSAGDAVIMRPHLLHASEKSMVAAHRRILHFEYSSYCLPEGINWSP
ncbi:MAG: phytanoyl-CoA dioxygenase family protein [Methylococcales bacterium]|nr:phytanoyl-CoA dioxygenase family protein [Methylococcales bacterium]